MHGNTTIDRGEYGFLRAADIVPKLVPVSRATLWRWVKSNSFPAPVRLSKNVTAWRVADVRRWCDEFAREAA